MRLLVVIPTLNEKGNISLIARKIFSVCKSAKLLFIDDNSIDGTRSEIINLRKNNNKVDYIFRPKKLGIGSAHKLGMKYAKKKNFKFLVTMDCDGTHNPIYITFMLKLLKSYDVVNTNRFNYKNGINKWALHRQILTKIRHFLVSYLLDLRFDSSGGFRCYNLKKINLNHYLEASHDGYSFLWESLFILKEKKYKIKDINVILPKRSLGFSKMKFLDVLDGFFYLIRIFILYRILK